MKKAPLARVKDEFGDKKTLVDKVAALVPRPADETRDQFKGRLSRLPNARLLRLFEAETRVKDEFGGRAKLVDALYALARPTGRVDRPYKDRLATYTAPRLLDLHRRMSRPSKRRRRKGKKRR